MNLITKFLIYMLAMFLTPTVSWASSLPDYYPRVFYVAGNIERIDWSSGQVVIGDKMLSPSKETVVMGLRSEKPTSYLRLTVGTNVGYTLASNGEIDIFWILPDGYIANRQGLLAK